MASRKFTSLLVIMGASSLLAPSLAIAAGSEPSGLQAKARALYDAGKYTQAEADYQSAVDPALKSTRSKAEQLARDLVGLARAQAAAGKWQDAEHNFKRALGLAEAMDMPRTFIDEARAGWTEAQVKLGRTPVSQAMAVEPSARPPSAVQPPAPLVVRRRRPAVSISGAGIVNPVFNPGLNNSFYYGRDPEEEEYLRQCAVNYSEQVYGVASAKATTDNLDLAIFYVNQHRDSDANAAIQKVAAAVPKLSTQDQHSLTTSVIDAAVRFSDSGQPLQASLLIQPVLKLSITNPLDSIEYATKLSRVADSFQRRRDYAQAETLEKQVVSMLEKALPQNDSRLAAERLKLAELYQQEGKPGSSTELYEMSLPIVAKNGINASLLRSYAALCDLYAKTNSQAKLKDTAQKLATAIGEAQTANPDFSWVNPVMNVAGDLAHSGNLETCRTLYTATIKSCHTPARDIYGIEFQLKQGIQSLVSQLEDIGQIPECEHVYQALLEANTTPAGETEAASSAYADLTLFYLKHDMMPQAKQSADKYIACIKRFGRSSRFYYRLAELSRQFQVKQQNDEALALTQVSIEMAGPGPYTDLRDIVDQYARAASLLDVIGDKPKALSTVDKAIAILNPHMPSELAPVLPKLTELAHKQFSEGQAVNTANLLTGLAQNAVIYQQQNNSVFKNQMVQQLATAFNQERMTEPACQLYKTWLEEESRTNGPSSLQVASCLNSYASALRMAGNTQLAQQCDDESRAIMDNWNRQQRGETGAYKPFTPLSETMASAKMRKVPADSSI